MLDVDGGSAEAESKLLKTNGTGECLAYHTESTKQTKLFFKFHTDIHADLVCSHTGYDVISYFRSKFEKTAENAASDGFESNCSGVAFCLPHQLVGVLFFLWSANDFQVLSATA